MKQLLGYSRQYTLRVSDSDAKAGVVGYSVAIGVCPITGRFTNLLWRVADGRLLQAYDQAAADELYLRQTEGG